MVFFKGSEASDEGLEEVLTTVKKPPKPARKRQNSLSAGGDFESITPAPVVSSSSFGRRVLKPSYADYDKPNGMKVGRTNSLDDKFNGEDMDLLRKNDKVKARKRNDSKGDRSNNMRIDRSDDNLNLFTEALEYGRESKMNGGTRSERRQIRGGDSRAPRDVDAKQDQRDGFDFLSQMDFKYGAMSSIQRDLDCMQDLMFPEMSGSSASGKDKQNDSKFARNKIAKRNRSISKGDSQKADKMDPIYAVGVGSSAVVATENMTNHKVDFLVSFC